MPDTDNGTKRGKDVIILTADPIGRMVAITRQDWIKDELQRFMNGEIRELRIVVYPLGIDTARPIGQLIFRQFWNETDEVSRPTD